MLVSHYTKALTYIFLIKLTEQTLATSQTQQLQSLYDNLGGAFWTTQTGWNNIQSNGCAANGVTCSGDGTSVKILQLNAFNLSGSISGKDLFSNFTALVALDFSQNPLLRGNFRTALSGLSQIYYINFSETSMFGTIPSWIQNFSLLIYLYIASSFFSGPLPDVFSNMTVLRYLSTGGTLINGSMPTSFYQLPQIREVYISSLQTMNLSSQFLSKNTLKKLGTFGAKVSGDLTTICSKNWDYCAIPGSICVSAGTPCNCTIDVCSTTSMDSTSTMGSTSSFSSVTPLYVSATQSSESIATVAFQSTTLVWISPSPVAKTDSSQNYNVIYVAIGASFGICGCAMLLYLWVRKIRLVRRTPKSSEREAIRNFAWEKDLYSYIRDMTVFKSGYTATLRTFSTQNGSDNLTQLLEMTFHSADDNGNRRNSLAPIMVDHKDHPQSAFRVQPIEEGGELELKTAEIQTAQ